MSSRQTTRTRATSQIDVVSYEPALYDQPGEGPALAEVRVRESFTGEGAVRFQQTANLDGTASFAAVDRVVGEVGGRSGGFVLDDEGAVANQVVTGSWFVAPGSGTSELASPRGGGGFTAAVSPNADSHVAYWFES
jgi:hypothetical protein